MRSSKGDQSIYRDKLTLSQAASIVVLVTICAGSSVYKAASLLAGFRPPAWPPPAPASPVPPARLAAAAAFPDDFMEEEEDAKAWSRPSKTRSRRRLLPSPVDIATVWGGCCVACGV